MATLELKPPRSKAEPELNLLLPKSTEQPLWKSLLQNLDDYFFPKKQPPLVLTSKPIPVKEIWGFYDYKKNGLLGSTIVHGIAVGVLIAATIVLGKKVAEKVKPHETVMLVAPTSDVPTMEPSKTEVHGGGGGGDRDKFQAPKGKLPKFDMEQ